MRCAWCGEILKFHGFRDDVGTTYRCPNANCVNWGITLAVPQLGSILYEKVIAEQGDPNWKPLLRQTWDPKCTM